jgi:site-specific DNA-methyltransferase (adenine-specific)
MKPNEGSYAANALKHGVAGLNIDGARIDYKSEKDKKEGQSSRLSLADKSTNQCAMGSLDRSDRSEISGRFPANIILDEEAAVMLDEQTGVLKSGAMDSVTKGLFPETFNTYGKQYVRRVTAKGDSGGASRFFYCAKASKAERNAGCEQLEIKQTIGGGGTNNTEDDVCGKYGSIKSAGHNFHPTVKPLALMEYLAKLTMTPSGGVVLDPYAGSGTTGVACINTGRECLLMEKEAEYWPIIESRIAAALAAAGKNK